VVLICAFDFFLVVNGRCKETTEEFKRLLWNLQSTFGKTFNTAQNMNSRHDDVVTCVTAVVRRTGEIVKNDLTVFEELERIW
jgi:hypothetical protein